MREKLGSMQLDRAVGSLLGLATGDALGAGYEFGPAVDDPEMIGGRGMWEPGEWTDDTQMAICIAEAGATGILDPVGVGERFLHWYRSHPKDVGIQTAGVLGKAKEAADLPVASTEYFHRHPNNAAGNGSLMRTAPIALTHLGDDEAIAEAALEVSALTHGDPLAGEACVIWCIGIDRAIREGRLDGVSDGLGLLPAQSRDRWAALLLEAESTTPRAFRPNGFVVKALQAAYAAVTHIPVPTDGPACLHFEHALKTAVGVGHDTDTVGAIAGSLLGARWGATAIPLRWRRMLHGWPGYRERDLTRLAILNARGQPDAQGWPVVESLLPYYREAFHPRGLVATLRDDPGMLLGDVEGLEKVKGRVDVVLSLCRVGTAEADWASEHHEIWLMDEAGPEDNPNLDFVLSDLAEYVLDRRNEGKRVYIHCVRSESRTPTVAAAYLAKRLNINGRDAIRRVTEVLPGARVNHGFEAALDRLGKK